MFSSQRLKHNHDALNNQPDKRKDSLTIIWRCTGDPKLMLGRIKNEKSFIRERLMNNRKSRAATWRSGSKWEVEVCGTSMNSLVMLRISLEPLGEPSTDDIAEKAERKG